MNQNQAHCANIIRQRIESTGRRIIGEHLEKQYLFMNWKLQHTNDHSQLTCWTFAVRCEASVERKPERLKLLLENHLARSKAQTP